jgi:tRNA modification GTPase trmE
MLKNDTIAAIATPLSESAIGIIRVCGDMAIDIVDKIYKGKKKLRELNSHTVNYGNIVVEEEFIDEVLVILMKGPSTYTGEDTVEINCHGGILITQRILEEVIKSGAVLAEPGEFTKRAFLNGKMDLSRAESVIDIIEAKNQYALKSSLMHLRGGLSELISGIRLKILDEVAFIEAALDDPEHYDLDEYRGELRQKVSGIKSELKSLLSTYERGMIIKEGIETVIVGKPNVGKSSILNLLSRQEKAIVTDVAGTTRDSISEQIKLSGININLTDTAGIRESDDLVESIGIKKSKELIESAELVICVLDSSKELSDEDKEILRIIEDKKAIILLNKSDKSVIIDKLELKKYTTHPVLEFSAKNAKGLDELEEFIRGKFYNKEIGYNDQIYITNIRHKQSIEETIESIDLVLQSIDMGMAEDFLSIDLVNAYEYLGEIIGESLDEDIINTIFAKFCMGK